MSEQWRDAIPHLPGNPEQEGQYILAQNIVYGHDDEAAQKLTLILPWAVSSAQENGTTYNRKYPLLVFVQGSGWTTPGFDYELPQLVRYAQMGYIVATVSHRSRLEGHPFPAFLQDVKSAIRFLRKNASYYAIDSDKVAIWGTSSGGNTALLVGLTADDPRYETKDNEGFSDSVCAVVDCFGPADIPSMWDDAKGTMNESTNQQYDEIHKTIFDAERGDISRQMKEISPYYQVKDGEKYPPFLLLHGTADTLVDDGQTVKMAERLHDAGCDVEAYLVDGAEHESTFWSKEVHAVIQNFLKKNLR